MNKNVSIQTKDLGSGEKHLLSIIVIVQGFKVACKACSIYKRAAIWFLSTQ